MATPVPFVPYPPIERHGVIGDRRTAALVAADGTIDWLCLPRYDGKSVFATLLDATRGGFWRLGPVKAVFGHQRYVGDSPVVVTTWTTDDWELELTDAMAGPQDERPAAGEESHVLLRRLRCLRGEAAAVFDLRPRDDCRGSASVTPATGGLLLRVGARTLFVWVSRPVQAEPDGAHVQFHLYHDQEFWSALIDGEPDGPWTVQRSRDVLNETLTYWQDWVDQLAYTGPRGDRVRRSAVTVHLLGYAPTGSLVAAPTTSLPERIGGGWNADYRFAWVRDASLSLAVLALLGDTKTARRYMDWVCGLDSSTDSPLQVVYRIDGGTDLSQHERWELYGYRGSQPIRVGNHAYQQRQLDSLGYFADCALIYLEQGGTWREEYWQMIRRAADYTAGAWRQPDNSIWELPSTQHYVSSKVMSWVTLERAVQIAERLGRTEKTAHWRATMAEIHTEVMQQGWSEHLSAFRQRYGADTLDAAVLLIPVMGFLPADHPQVVATVARITESLTINGYVYRFHPGETPGLQDLPLGEFEGAFLPCTCWLATTYAKAGRPDEAEAVLARVEHVTGGLGLLAEGVDARSETLLGNFPLLFSQIEYIRAVMELAKARPLDRTRLMVGKMAQRLGRLFQSEG